MGLTVGETWDSLKASDLGQDRTKKFRASIPLASLTFSFQQALVKNRIHYLALLGLDFLICTY